MKWELGIEPLKDSLVTIIGSEIPMWGIYQNERRRDRRCYLEGIFTMQT